MRPETFRLFCLGATVCVTSLQQPPEPSLTLDGKCVNLVDGDTADIELRMVVRVRLLDLWTPEKFAKHGNQSEKARGLAAKARGKELLEGKPVRVTIPLGVDLKDSLTLNRVLGRVTVLDGNGKPLFDYSETMVKEGFGTKEEPK